MRLKEPLGFRATVSKTAAIIHMYMNHSLKEDYNGKENMKSLLRWQIETVMDTASHILATKEIVL